MPNRRQHHHHRKKKLLIPEISVEAGCGGGDLDAEDADEAADVVGRLTPVGLGASSMAGGGGGVSLADAVAAAANGGDGDIDFPRGLPGGVRSNRPSI